MLCSQQDRACVVADAKFLSWIAGRASFESYVKDNATLDDLREAVTTLEDTERTARRVFGAAYPVTEEVEICLREARGVLSARETPLLPGSA